MRVAYLAGRLPIQKELFDVGADDYHVSKEYFNVTSDTTNDVAEKMKLLNYILNLTDKWDKGEITSNRFAEVVYGVINKGVAK